MIVFSLRMLQSAPLDHPDLPRALAAMGIAGPPTAIPVTGRMPEGRCYFNVKKQCRSSGGSAVSGWSIKLVEDRCLVAWHHAVWQSVCGQLEDVTASPEESTTYVRADDYAQYLDGRSAVAPRFFRLWNHKTVRAYEKATLIRVARANAHKELVFRLGAYLDSDGYFHIRPVTPEEYRAVHLADEARRKAIARASRAFEDMKKLVPQQNRFAARSGGNFTITGALDLATGPNG